MFALNTARRVSTSSVSSSDLELDIQEGLEEWEVKTKSLKAMKALWDVRSCWYEPWTKLTVHEPESILCPQGMDKEEEHVFKQFTV